MCAPPGQHLDCVSPDEYFLAGRTRATLANIAALLTEANRAAPGARFGLSALACKVHMRRRRICRSAERPFTTAGTEDL